MKKLVLLIAIFNFGFIYGQVFEFKKVATQGTNIKMKGEIVVKDSIITIQTGGQTSEFKVINTLNTETSKQYKALDTSEYYEIRFTLNTPKESTKFNVLSLLMETKDEFSGNFATVLYYLKETDDE